MKNNREKGIAGELFGEQFLAGMGYKIIGRNFRTRYGEIDIIAREKEDLVFVEVKMRNSSGFGLPQESVTAYKQERIIKSALQYVKSGGFEGANIRFDVLAIGPGPDKIEVIKSAFGAPSRYTL